MSSRRSRKSATARVRRFWIVIAIALVAAATGGYYLAAWPGFYPRRIAVTGMSVIAKAEILQRAEIDPHRNLWLQNMGAAAARIGEIPYVKAVSIHRRLPADATIVVIERKPFAIVSDGSAGALVDDQLRVLDSQTDRTDLPQLRWAIGAVPAGRFLHAPALVQLAADCRHLLKAGVPVARLSFDKAGSLNAWLASHILVEFGDDADIAQKARLVNPILSQAPQTGRRIRALDLRAPKTPVLVFVP